MTINLVPLVMIFGVWAIWGMAAAGGIALVIVALSLVLK